MGRVLHVRIHGLEPDQRDTLQRRFQELAQSRQWRDSQPWLADRLSRDLFSMEYFRHSSDASASENPEAGPLSAAGFIRLDGDEMDALAILFILRDISERFRVRVVLRDQDNPILKLRHVDMTNGRLQDGNAIEEILVKRPIFKKLPNGFRIEMYPPRALESAFGATVVEDAERRNWAFLIHGMRGSAANFFEAEAEAMRIYHGLRRLE